MSATVWWIFWDSRPMDDFDERNATFFLVKKAVVRS